MNGFRFQQELAVLIEDPVAELEPHALHPQHPDLDRQQIVIAGGGFVAQVRLDDGENVAGVLPGQDRAAERAQEFAARRFQQIEIARVIDMVADGAFGVGDAMEVAEWLSGPP